MPHIIEQIAKFEAKYGDEVILRNFLKRYGTAYTQEDLINFLRRRYEIINLRESPDYLKPRYDN